MVVDITNPELVDKDEFLHNVLQAIENFYCNLYYAIADRSVLILIFNLSDSKYADEIEIYINLHAPTASSQAVKRTDIKDLDCMTYAYHDADGWERGSAIKVKELSMDDIFNLMEKVYARRLKDGEVCHAEVAY